MHASDCQRPKRGPGRLVMVACLLGLCLGTAKAADTKDRDQDQLRRLRAQVQQLQQAQAQAQEAALRAAGEKAALAAGLQKLQAGAAQHRHSALGAQQQVQTLAQALAAAVAERDQAQTDADTSRQLLLQLHSQLQQHETHLARATQDAQAQGQNLAGLAAEQNRVGQQLATCSADNFSLLTIANELADRLTGATLLSRAAASEPFFQLRRVQLENLAQTYRDRAQSLRFTPAQEAHARPAP